MNYTEPIRLLLTSLSLGGHLYIAIKGISFLGNNCLLLSICGTGSFSIFWKFFPISEPGKTINADDNLHSVGMQSVSTQENFSRFSSIQQFGSFCTLLEEQWEVNLSS